jgi:hypothetical protein
MPDFNDFLKTLKDDLLNIAKDNLEEFKDEILKDGTAFAHKTKNDLERWTVALAEGNLTPEDFEFLIKGKKDLAEMEALKQTGLGKIKLNRIRDQIIDTLIGSVLKIFT